MPDDPETSMLLFLGLLGLVNLLGVGLIVLVGATFFGAFRDVFAECTAARSRWWSPKGWSITCSPITCGRARFF